VKGNSRCITIEAEGEEDVRAVCDGEVESVMDLGDTKAVLLRHGRYFTVYSNLPEVTVAKGDCVKEGQVLGRIIGDGQLDFYVYYENDNWFFDPEKWLKR
jgi:septal ring factor EnvC (AmiA/AmiB activator)